MMPGERKYAHSMRYLEWTKLSHVGMEVEDINFALVTEVIFKYLGIICLNLSLIKSVTPEPDQK